MAAQKVADLGPVADQIAAWLRSHVRTAGATHLILGLSGGIDSAVVCALAARAVGSSKVVAAIMPIHSREDDARDAEAAARAFDVKPTVVDLTDTYETLLLGLETRATGRDADTALQARANIKPRLRMTALYYLAQLHNGLVVGTGNKIELSIGYFTKYGDGGVDLLPIADFAKSEVRAMARELGVPARIIARPPSAGLWEGQTDEAEIGLTYDQLDRAIRSYSSDPGGDPEAQETDRVRKLIARSEHKRQPIPVYIREDSRG